MKDGVNVPGYHWLSALNAWLLVRNVFGGETRASLTAR